MAIPKPPLQSIRYIVICIGGILGFSLLAIFPSYKALGNMDLKISKLQQKNDEQKALHPLFLDLLKNSKRETPSKLPFPKKAKLAREETGGISDFFQELARKHNFKVQRIVPDVLTLTDGSGYLALDATMTGDFLSFRKLMLQLGEIPYLEHIESIGIRTVKNEKEFRLKVWIAQE